MLEPSIQTIDKIRLAGIRLRMSFANNRTGELWRAFMPRVTGIDGKLGDELYSVEVYDGPEFFDQFDPHRVFDKWAAVAVARDWPLPAGLELLEIPGGEYAVFPYRGRSSAAAAAYRYIYGEWLPASGYVLDDRPHFAVMGERYRTDDSASEEEIWIPVRPL